MPDVFVDPYHVGKSWRTIKGILEYEWHLFLRGANSSKVSSDFTGKVEGNNDSTGG